MACIYARICTIFGPVARKQDWFLLFIFSTFKGPYEKSLFLIRTKNMRSPSIGATDATGDVINAITLITDDQQQ